MWKTIETLRSSWENWVKALRPNKRPTKQHTHKICNKLKHNATKVSCKLCEHLVCLRMFFMVFTFTTFHRRRCILIPFHPFFTAIRFFWCAFFFDSFRCLLHWRQQKNASPAMILIIKFIDKSDGNASKNTEQLAPFTTVPFFGSWPCFSWHFRVLFCNGIWKISKKNLGNKCLRSRKCHRKIILLFKMKHTL